jgi:hypothetical protein
LTAAVVAMLYTTAASALGMFIRCPV